MKTNFQGKLRDFGDLEYGSIFIVSVGGSNYFCMKTFEKRDGARSEIDSCVVLVPALPDYDGKPGVLDQNVVHNLPFLETENVILEVSIGLSDIQFDSGYSPSPGTIFVFSTGTFLCVNSNSNQYLLNVETGELLQRPPEVAHAMIGRWRLIRPLDRDIDELGAHPAT